MPGLRSSPLALNKGIGEVGESCDILVENSIVPVPTVVTRFARAACGTEKARWIASMAESQAPIRGDEPDAGALIHCVMFAFPSLWVVILLIDLPTRRGSTCPTPLRAMVV